MKYAKQWTNDLVKMPACLRDACISYKDWKKRCKDIGDVHQAMRQLESECKRVESCFQSCYHTWATPPPFLACIVRTKVTPMTNYDLLAFASMNAMTTYKICKRMQKIMHNTLPMQWLISTRAAHAFAFLGGKQTGHLQWSMDHAECPICMEATTKKNTMMVLGCGHFACHDCCARYAGVANMRGTWNNVISYASRKDCFMCHYPTALSNAVAVE